MIEMRVHLVKCISSHTNLLLLVFSHRKYSCSRTFWRGPKFDSKLFSV